MIEEGWSDNMETIHLENDHLRIVIDSKTGNFLEIYHKSRDLNLIQGKREGPPWRIELTSNGDWIEDYSNFRITHSREDRITPTAEMEWATEKGITIKAKISLPKEEANVHLHIKIDNHGDVGIDKLEYPIIRGIRNLSEASANYLVHSQGSGFLFRNPFQLFQRPAGNGNAPDPKQGLRFSPYPEGYQGSTMQFMAYYCQVGGFYFATQDITQGVKWFNFFKNQDGDLEVTFIHQNADIRPGEGMQIPYPILLGALFEGNWYEAADRYKSWASQQPWTAKGLLNQRTDISTWLLEEVGFATFGIKSSCDRSAWLSRFSQMTDQPVFHILGIDWPKNGGDYHFFLPDGNNNLLGGKGDWFPARFHPNNLKAIKERGDYWAAFEFDILFTDKKSQSSQIRAARLKWPKRYYVFDDYPPLYVCPATDFLPPLHKWRDTQLVEEYGVDGLYYDFSVSNMLMMCRNPEHKHPMGGGGWMISAIQHLYTDTKHSAIQKKGRYVPQGTECIHELLIPYLDFYQARAEACPLSPMEADFFRQWIISGDAEKIPLFAYVYHEYGPIRLDGWAQLTKEIGELFYWVAGRVTLWGGILELNYEFTPLENLGQMQDDIEEHYIDIEPNYFDLDQDKAAFLRDIATFRTKVANDYLAYSSMQRPLNIEVPTISMDYYHYNGKPSWDHTIEQGIMMVPEILHSAWKYKNERLAFMFLNLNKEHTRTLSLDIDLAVYGVCRDEFNQVKTLTSRGERLLIDVQHDRPIALSLPPRQFVLLEFAKS